MHAVASNHTDVIQEAGWQFEFEIRESALIKLQQQLQEDVPAPPVGPEVRFFCHLYTKCIILPRQARDKHRESTRKRASGLSFVRQFRLQTRHNLPLSDETWVVCQHRLGSNKFRKHCGLNILLLLLLLLPAGRAAVPDAARRGVKTDWRPPAHRMGACSPTHTGEFERDSHIGWSPHSERSFER